MLFLLMNLHAQDIPSLNSEHFEYEASEEYPYGRMNPNAPNETTQFNFMVGECDCIDSIKNPADGQWYVFKSIWNAKFVLNGQAIQDIGWNPIFSVSSMRMYNISKKVWEVTFFKMPQPQSGKWTGRKEGENMVMRQKTSNGGVDGESRLTFYDIRSRGFKWKSEFFGDDGSYSSSWWISCTKR